jgi:hypothetical protein
MKIMEEKERTLLKELALFGMNPIHCVIRRQFNLESAVA